jgi:hypothetical protein
MAVTGSWPVAGRPGPLRIADIKLAYYIYTTPGKGVMRRHRNARPPLPAALVPRRTSLGADGVKRECDKVSGQRGEDNNA